MKVGGQVKNTGSFSAKTKRAWAEIKSHPIWVIAGTVVATFTLTMRFAFPIQYAHLQNRVESQSVEIGQLKDEKSALNSLLADTRAQKDAAQDAVHLLEYKDSFSSDDVFPAGWRSVVIGDNQAKLERFYKDVDRSVPYWSVKSDAAALFREGTFFFNSPHTAPERQVSEELLFFRDSPDHPASETRRIVIGQLSEHFGAPKQVVNEDSGIKTLTWSALGYNLEVQEIALGIDATCDTPDLLKARGVDFALTVPCREPAKPRRKL